MEGEHVRARLEVAGELADPPVLVRRAGRDLLTVAGELDAHPAGGLAAAGVEHVGGQ
jgi:hypothetical protein